MTEPASTPGKKFPPYERHVFICMNERPEGQPGGLAGAGRGRLVHEAGRPSNPSIRCTGFSRKRPASRSRPR